MEKNSKDIQQRTFKLADIKRSIDTYGNEGFLKIDTKHPASDKKKYSRFINVYFRNPDDDKSLCPLAFGFGPFETSARIKPLADRAKNGESEGISNKIQITFAYSKMTLNNCNETLDIIIREIMRQIEEVKKEGKLEESYGYESGAIRGPIQYKFKRDRDGKSKGSDIEDPPVRFTIRARESNELICSIFDLSKNGKPTATMPDGSPITNKNIHEFITWKSIVKGIVEISLTSHRAGITINASTREIYVKSVKRGGFSNTDRKNAGLDSDDDDKYIDETQEPINKDKSARPTLNTTNEDEDEIEVVKREKKEEIKEEPKSDDEIEEKKKKKDKKKKKEEKEEVPDEIEEEVEKEEKKKKKDKKKKVIDSDDD